MKQFQAPSAGYRSVSNWAAEAMVLYRQEFPISLVYLSQRYQPAGGGPNQSRSFKFYLHVVIIGFSGRSLPRIIPIQASCGITPSGHCPVDPGTPTKSVIPDITRIRE